MAPKDYYKKTIGKAKIAFSDLLKSPSPEMEIDPQLSYTGSEFDLKSPSPEKDHGAEAASTVEGPFKRMPLESSSDDDDSKTIRPAKTVKNDADSAMGLVIKAPTSDPPTTSSRRRLVSRTPASDPSSLNAKLAKDGCKLCNAVAVCCTAHAQGYTYETMAASMDIQQEDEEAKFGHIDPKKMMEEREIVMKALEEAKKKMTLDQFFGPLCCAGPTFDQRASSPGLNQEKHGPIHKFVELLAQVRLRDNLNKFSDEQLGGIAHIIKVNPIIDHEEHTTWFFTPIDKDNVAAGYSLFLKADTQKFTSLGPNSHLHFFCKTHRRKFRIGYYTVKWIEGNKYATFGDARVDKLMKVPMKEKPSYQY